MGAPHNKYRYGEVWDQDRINEYLTVIAVIKDLVVLSGGWAWHAMSPLGHTELKHAHDHKDLDIFIKPTDVTAVIERLTALGFVRVWTKYDRLPSKEDFRRYEQTINSGSKTIRLTIDFFVSDIPSIEVKGVRVVEPLHLLSLYSNIHSSDKCFAVQAAAKLLKKGISPVDRRELTEIPKQ